MVWVLRIAILRLRKRLLAFESIDMRRLALARRLCVVSVSSQYHGMAAIVSVCVVYPHMALSQSGLFGPRVVDLAW